MKEVVEGVSHDNLKAEGCWLISLKYALFILTKFGLPQPWSPQQVKVYLEKIQEEMNTPGVHAYNSYKRVWAQKPFNA